MIKILKSSSPNTLAIVTFEKTLYSGRKAEQSIEANISPFDDEGPSINIEGVNLQMEDVAEFIEALKLAQMIASGELEIK